MICLGIETSCDETSVSVIRNGREVLSNIVSTQIDIKNMVVLYQKLHHVSIYLIYRM